MASTVSLDHYAKFGEIYDTLEVCENLAISLNRLRRQGLLDEPAWIQDRSYVDQIRSQLENRMESQS